MHISQIRENRFWMSDSFGPTRYSQILIASEEPQLRLMELRT